MSPGIGGNPMKRVICLGLGALLLAGCSMTLPVTGSLEDGSETFNGSATGHTDGAGELQITTSAGVTCRGTFVYVTQREGSGTFQCADGRSGPFTFVSTGSRGTGRAPSAASTSPSRSERTSVGQLLIREAPSAAYEDASLARGR